VSALQVALLRGDVVEIGRLVDGELPTHRRSDRGLLLAGRSFAHILSSEFGAAYDLAQSGLSLGPEHLLLRSLCSLSSAMGGLEREGSDITSVQSTAEEIIRLSDADLLKDAWAVALTAEAAMSVGRLDLAETLARRVWIVSRESDPPEAVFAGQTLVRALLFEGRLADASLAAEPVKAAALRHELIALLMVIEASLAYIDALGGRPDELVRRATSIDEMAGQCSSSYFVAGAMVLTAYALAAAQHGERAADILLRGAGGPHLPNIQLVDRVYGYELLVTVALSIGDVGAARQWSNQAAELTGLPAGGMAAAALRRTNARIAVATGEVTAGAVMAEQAAIIADVNAGHLDATRARLLAGSARLFDADDNWPARLELSDASEQARILGATSLALLARRDLRSIGLRLVGEPQAPMTPREREVAELLLAGASNSQIAAALGVSPRTVQSHVSRILKTLDLPSRAAVPRVLQPANETDHPRSQLTPRQRQVADLISRGYTNDGTARSLEVSVKTIEKHLGDIYRRLGLDSRSALAAYWTG
jgi:DNA-binding NarL/FixJ family response regulator